ncbi:MAG: alpha/beta hydrolase [Sphingobacteriaceae bacterium]|nr:MAG: alpha/beta hydrolase [Sphingobacteriaceae bacterium]
MLRNFFSKNDLKVLIHYPKQGTRFPADPDVLTNAAWNSLVAPRYNNLKNYKTKDSLFSNNKEGKYIHLADADLYYETYGSGQPLLLLHGNSASISSFYAQIPELAKHYRVIALDTRGQGKSTDASTVPLSYDKFAQDAKQLLDSLHIDKASIVGWSDGGNTGLILAAKYPSYVNKLVTMGAVTSPAGVDPALMNRFKESLKKTNQTSGHELSISTRLLTLLVDEPHITTTELENIQAPVLVIAGEKDVVKFEQTKLIAGHIKNSKLLIIKEATHYAPQEKPEQFNRLVLEFLK